jgi:hypothetical protein
MATNRILKKPMRIHWKVVAGDEFSITPIQTYDVCLTTDDLRFYRSL